MAKSSTFISAKSKSNAKRIDRPFAVATLQRARRIAKQYRILMRLEDGEYFGQALELPGAMGDGKTPGACLRSTVESVTTVVAVMIENGQIPPLPASDQRREEQVNVRLSKLEKVTFEETARSRGFRGLSEFMRAATLSSVTHK